MPDSDKRIKGEIPVIVTFAIVGIFVSLTQLIAWNEAVGWDSVSYLEIADQVLKGNVSALFGSYWSPGFPLLISLLKLISSFYVALDEFFILSLAMFCSYLLAFSGFTCFARALLRLHMRLQRSEEQQGVTTAPPLLLLIAMYSAFLFSVLTISELSHKTPDVLACSVTYFALAQWLKMQEKCTVSGNALLGFLVGIAYWAKNFNLGWGPVFIFSIIFLDQKRNLRGKELVALLATYFVTMASLAVPISLVANRPTFSDVVKVGCSWSGTVGYMGIVHGRGPTFLHPTRIFNSEPIFYEFATPYADITYPPFYAPQYWYEGVPFKLDWSSYTTKIVSKALQYGNVLAYCLLLVLLILGVAARGLPFIKERVRVLIPAIVPSLFGMLIVYFMLDFEGRYYAASLVPTLCFFVFCLGVPKRAAVRPLKVGLFILIGWMLLLLLLKTWFHFYFACPPYAHWLAQISKLSFPPSPVHSQHRANIEALRKAGLKPGDRIARLTRCGDGEFYWAKGAGLKIVCESPEVDKFWLSTPEQRQALYKKLRQFGVVAIVQDWCPPSKSEYPVPSDPGWQRVGGTKTFIYILNGTERYH